MATTLTTLSPELPTDPRRVDIAAMQLGDILSDHAWCDLAETYLEPDQVRRRWKEMLAGSGQSGNSWRPDALNKSGFCV